MNFCFKQKNIKRKEFLNNLGQKRRRGGIKRKPPFVVFLRHIHSFFIIKQVSLHDRCNWICQIVDGRFIRVYM